MAHLYNNDWSFRASLGAIIGTRPVLKQTMNSGFQPITVELPAKNSIIQPGNLIVITEEGGDATGSAPAGEPVIAGWVESVPRTLDVNGWKHEVTITPFVAELGDNKLTKNYTIATDVAQMVRDAVSLCPHLRFTWQSIPNTGITAIYNFSEAPALEVLDHARLIAGTNYSWFVDAIGVVWFQAINTTSSATFTVTPKDFSSLSDNGGDISGLKNYCLVVGAMSSTASAPFTATYSNATSQAQYGLRAVQPPISVPGITDTPTLQNIANTIGGIYDRVINRVTIDLPAFPFRIKLGQPGGATMRYFSPAKYSLVESESGTGTYSPTYVVLDVETDGIQQKVTIGDVPLTSATDVSYQADRLAARMGIQSIVQPQMVGSPTAASTGYFKTYANTLFAANDGTYDRAQMGNLASYTGPNGTNSPAQWGFRAVDQSGNALFDSMGLISVMMPVGNATGFYNGVLNNFSGTSDTIIPGTTATFSPTRTARVFILMTAYCHTFSPAVPTNEFGSLTLYQNGVSTGTVIFYHDLAFFTYPFVSLLGAGSYTFDLRASVNTGTDSTTITGAMFIFQLGAA